MKYIISILLFSLLSCEHTEYLPIVIIANEISEEKTHEDEPVDFAYHEPQQLINCDTPLVVIDTPQFIVVAIELFDGINPNAIFGHSWLDFQFDSLEHMLQYLDLTNYTIYQNGNSIAAIIRGTNDISRVDGKIWTRSASMTKQYFGASSQGFIFYGALTPDEYLNVAQEYQSVRIFNFLNTNYSFDEYETIAQTILGNCKHGRYWANFKHATITDSTFCQFIAHDWEIVTGNNACQP
jgi:hypothetical protein